MECNGTYVKWIKDVFGECVVTNNDKWSFAIGILSSVFWLLCFIPQMIQNCRTKTVEGLSPFFFSLLFFASLISFLGLFIIGGLITQFITYALFLLFDGTLFLQYLIYSHCYRKNVASIHKDESENDDIVIQSTKFQNNDVIGGVAVLTTLAACKIDFATPYNKENITGTILGWLSTVIFTLSRIPQISKNCSAKKVRDLSPSYVLLTLAANSSFVLSLFIKSLDGSFLWAQLPWIVGSICPMLFDCIFLVQMCIYGTETSKVIPKENEKDDVHQFLLL